MNLHQFRFVQEAARRNLNLTETAKALFTSQPGVSKAILELEEELGVDIFSRHGKRLRRITEPGEQVLACIEIILREVANLKRIGEEYSRQDSGTFSIATTHTQARYVLPEIIRRFREEFPAVRLVLHQGSPTEIVNLLQQGQADIGLATEAVLRSPDLVTFPYLSWHHVVLVAKGHPLEHAPQVNLAQIAAYPIITYHAGFTGRPAIDRAFAKAGLAPDIMMEALDSDVIKAYVEMGLGVGIVASVAYDADRDNGLVQVPSEGLFETSVSRIAVRRGRFLRDFATRFITLAAPDLTDKGVRKAIAQEREA